MTADVDENVVVAADVAMDDVKQGSALELGVLQPVRCLQLAVRAGGAVEDLHEGAQHVLVGKEDLVVVPRAAQMALNEDGVGAVDHDLPYVVERCAQGTVTSEVALAPLDHSDRVGQVECPEVPLAVVRPADDFPVDHPAQGRSALGRGHVEGDVLGPRLHPSIHFHQRRDPRLRYPRHLNAEPFRAWPF